MEIASGSLQLEYNKMSVGNIVYRHPKSVYVLGIKPPPNTLATSIPKGPVLQFTPNITKK